MLTRLSTGQRIGQVLIPNLINDTLALDGSAQKPAVRAELEAARISGAQFLQHWLLANEYAATTAPSTVLDQIIADMSGTHAGAVCGTAGYDWEHGPVRQQVLPEGKPRATIWAMNNYDCANPIGTGSVEIRTPQLWAHSPTGWTLIVSSVYGSQVNNANYGPQIYGGAGTGPVFGIPANRGVQWFGPQQNIPSGCDGLLATYEARLATPGATSLMVNAGADWWGDSGNRGACVGRFKRLTASWQRFSAYTMTDAALRAAGSPV